MALHGPRLLGVLFALLLSAVMSGADTLHARSPQDVGDTTSLHFYTPTPSFTGTASDPTVSSVTFELGDVPDMSVCGRSTISWEMTGNTFYVMGIAAMPVSTDGQATIITTMNGGLGIGYYTWDPVNVSAGEYVLEVSIASLGMLYYSDTFYVEDSSDHSCLTSSSSSGTLGPSSTPGTIPPASATNPSSSAGDASGAPAIGAVSDGPAMSAGGIAGVVIGGVIFVGALIAILMLFRRCRSGRAMGAPRGGLFEKRKPKGAISINSRGGSFSSYHGAPARGVGNSAFGMVPHYNLNDPSRSRSDFGYGISDEDVRSPSITGEKPLAHAPVELGVAVPGVAHRSPRAYRDSFGSIASGSTTAAGSPVVATSHYKPTRHHSLQNTTDPFSSSPPTPSPRPSGDDYQRTSDYQRASDGQSQVPVALFSPSSVTSTPRTYGSPGVPRDISIASSSSPDLTYEPEVATPTAAVTAPTVSRRAPPAPPTAAPAPSQPAGRRTKSGPSRKPVPVYEPSITGEALELVEPSSPALPSGTSASYYNDNAGQHSRVSLGQSSSTGNDWSVGAAHSHSPASGSAGSYLSRGSRGSGHSLHGYTNYADIPELNHKSSFGDRHMHVLIPDPPPREMQ